MNSYPPLLPTPQLFQFTVLGDHDPRAVGVRRGLDLQGLRGAQDDGHDEEGDAHRLQVRLVVLVVAHQLVPARKKRREGFLVYLNTQRLFQHG